MKKLSNKKCSNTNNIYNELVIDTLKRKFINDMRHISDEFTNKIELENLTYLITVTYNHSNANKFSNLHNHISKINKNYLDLHKRISIDLVGGNIGRRKYLQPFCWMFVDGSATRSGGFIHEARAGENTHHHGLMYVHPSTIGDFKKLTSDFQLMEWARQSENVQNIHIEKMADLETYLSTADYAGKLGKQLRYTSSIGSDLDFIAPPFKEGELQKLTSDI